MSRALGCSAALRFLADLCQCAGPGERGEGDQGELPPYEWRLPGRSPRSLSCFCSTELGGRTEAGSCPSWWVTAARMGVGRGGRRVFSAVPAGSRASGSLSWGGGVLGRWGLPRLALNVLTEIPIFMSKEFSIYCILKKKIIFTGPAEWRVG